MVAALCVGAGWNASDSYEQQDVSELLVLLYDALELKFKDTPQVRHTANSQAWPESHDECLSAHTAASQPYPLVEP